MNDHDDFNLYPPGYEAQYRPDDAPEPLFGSSDLGSSASCEEDSRPAVAPGKNVVPHANVSQMKWFVLAVGILLLFLVGGLAFGLFDSDTRLRRQVAGSWETKTGALYQYDKSNSVQGLIIKCQFAEETDSRGRNLIINFMPTHVKLAGLPISLPDFAPTLHGVWKIRGGNLVLRIDQIDDDFVKKIVPFAEVALGTELLHREVTLPVTIVDNGHIAIGNKVTFERSGQ